MASVDTGIILSAKQCIDIGHQAITEKRYYQSVRWMETALTRVQDHNDSTASLNEVETQIEWTKKLVSLCKSHLSYHFSQVMSVCSK